MPATKVRSKGKQKDTAKLAQPELSKKEQRKLQREKAKVRQQVFQYCGAIFAFSAFVAFLGSLVAEPKLGVAGGLAIACLALSFKYPRYALYGFIIYLPLSGTVTYALGGSAILQLAKDAIFFPALLAVMLFCKKYKQPLILPTAIKTPLLIVMTFLMMVLLLVNGSQQLSAGGEIPILLGVLGLKALVGYLLLMTCMYYLIRTQADLYFLLRVQVVMIILCCALGFIQFMMLKTGICPGTQGSGEDLFKASLEARCFVGGSLLHSQFKTRLPGTFVAPWQWAWFLISSTFFAVGTAFGDRSWLWRILGIIAMVMIMVMAVVSGQRIALAMVFVCAGALLVALVLLGIINIKRFLPIGVVLFVVLGILLTQYTGMVVSSVQNFQGRWNASPPTEFITHQLEWAMNEQQGLLGRGLGRATNAARIFGRTALVETYHSKLLYETGPLGLVLMLFLFTMLTIATFRAFWAVKEPNLRVYGACMWGFVLIISYFPYYYPLDVDPVNVYYWFAAGILIKLPEIDRQERLKHSLEGDTKRKLSKKELRQLKQSQKAVEFK